MCPGSCFRRANLYQARPRKGKWVLCASRITVTVDNSALSHRMKSETTGRRCPSISTRSRKHFRSSNCGATLGTITFRYRGRTGTCPRYVDKGCEWRRIVRAQAFERRDDGRRSESGFEEERYPQLTMGSVRLNAEEQRPEMVGDMILEKQHVYSCLLVQLTPM